MDTHTHKQDRKFGGTEYLFRNTAGVVELTLKGPIDTEILNKAVNRVLVENPIFACRIIKKGENYSFQYDQNYKDILKTITIDDDDDKSRIIVEGMALQFGNNDMVFHCTLLSCENSEHNTLLITYNHAIADGGSLHYFVKTLFASYVDISNGDESTQPPTISPPLQEYSQKKTIRDFKEIISRELAIRFKKHASWPCHGNATVKERLTKSIYHKISPDLTVKIIKSCRKHRTTPHGVFMAAMLFAMARRLPENDRPFSMTNNINMRPMYKIPDQQMGTYVSIINSLTTVTKDMDFWTLAKDSRKALSMDSKRNLPAMSEVIYYPVTRYIPRSIENKVLNGPDMGRVSNLVIANLGKLEIPKVFGEIAIENIISHVAIHHLGPNFGLILMDYQGRFGFNLHYVWPLTTNSEAQHVMNDFLKLLERCVEENKFSPLEP